MPCGRRQNQDWSLAVVGREVSYPVAEEMLGSVARVTGLLGTQ